VRRCEKRKKQKKQKREKRIRNDEIIGVNDVLIDLFHYQ